MVRKVAHIGTLEFEELVSQALTVFTHTTRADFDKKLDAFMNHLRGMLQVDLCYFFSYDEATGMADLAYESIAPGVLPFLEKDIILDQPIITKFPYATRVLMMGEPLVIRNEEDLVHFTPENQHFLKEVVRVKSFLYIPLKIKEQIYGFFGFSHMADFIDWQPITINRLRILGDILTNALNRLAKEQVLVDSHNELSELQARLEAENKYFENELIREYDYFEPKGTSTAIRNVIQQIKQIAPLQKPVLLTGEIGTGKEYFARAIHHFSRHASKSFFHVHCGTLTDDGLNEIILYWKENSNSINDNIEENRIPTGTLFLDLITEMSLSQQTRLIDFLDNLEYRVYMPRIVCSTTKNLQKSVEKGQFKSNLFYHLNMFPIFIPPLRERKEDIPALTEYFVKKTSEKLGLVDVHVPPGILDQYMSYSWPGNISELENVIERSLLTSEKATLRPDMFLDYKKVKEGNRKKDHRLEMVISNHITHVLKLCNWKVEGRGGASELLKIHPSTLRSKLKKLGIRRR